jgi:hypothetical protein
MHRLLLSAILALGAALPLAAYAQEPIPVPPQPTPPEPIVVAPPALQAVTTGIIKSPCNSCEHSVTVNKLTLVPEETAVAIPRMALREVEVGRDVVTKMELTFHEERQTITEMVLKPRVVEQQVVVMTLKEETVVDPITCKPCKVMKQCPVVQTVKVTVYDTVPEERAVMVRVACLKPVEQQVAIKKLVVDETTVAAICRKYHYLLVPSELPIPRCPCVCFP